MDKKKLNEFLKEIGLEKEDLEFNKDKIDNFVNEVNTKDNVNSYYIAKMLVEENKLIKLDNLIYAYNGRCYQCITNTDIESLIHEVNKNLSEKQRKEILKKVYFDAPRKIRSSIFSSFNNSMSWFNLSDIVFSFYKYKKTA